MRATSVVFLLAVLLAGGVADAAAQKEGAPSASASGPVTITLWELSWWKDYTQPIIDAFEASHPNTKLNIELHVQTGYVEKVMTAIAGGKAPDVAALSVLDVISVAGQDLLQSWNPYTKGMDFSDFDQAGLKASTYRGELYAMPNRSDTFAYLYNQKMFDDVGLPYPKLGWTYQDMLKMAQKITVRGEKYGVGIAASLSNPSNVFQSFAPVLWAFGGDFLDAGYTKAIINNAQGIAGITFWTELYTKHHVVPEGSLNFQITQDVMPLFAQNKVALFPSSSAQFTTLKAQKDLRFAGVVGPDGWNRSGGWSYTIPEGSPHAQAGRQYALWFVRPENLAKFMIRQPSRTSACNVAPWNSPEFRPWVDAAKWTKVLPLTPAWSQVQTVIIQELQKILQQQETPTDGATAMAVQIDKILKAQ